MIVNKKNIIKIVWLVNDFYVNNFISVYKECQKNEKFEIIVLSVPHLKTNFSKLISSEKIHKFLKKRDVDNIDSYDSKNNRYFPIENFKPDYIFTTYPYDIYMPEDYRSYNLNKIAKLCNVHYGAILRESDKNYSEFFCNEFYKNAYQIFVSSKFECSKLFPCRVSAIGSLKLDEYYNYYSTKNKATFSKKETLDIVWKPRWTLDEKESNLFKYLKDFYQFVTDNKDINLILLTHPLLEEKLKTENKFEYYNKYISKLNKLKNFKIESGFNFLKRVLNSDILIADYSSIILEYTTTAKPIIYTKSNTQFNSFGNKVIDNSFQVNNFSEIIKIISDIKRGKDPLKIQRIKNKNKYFFTPPKKLTVAQFLLFVLEKDYNENFINTLFFKNVISSIKNENSLLQENNKLLLEKNKNLIKKNMLLSLQNKELNYKLKIIENKLLKIIESNSWKITKPIRLLKKIWSNF